MFFSSTNSTSSRSVAHDDMDLVHVPLGATVDASPPRDVKPNLRLSRLGSFSLLRSLGNDALSFKGSAGNDGLVEVWADGKPIAKVTGRIGFATRARGKQYFKFGPYRDRETSTIFAMLTNYLRSTKPEW
jgi:hypothetical protein